MAVYIGQSKGKNFYKGQTKIKKMYKGSTQIYSSGNIVTYYVDSGVSYQEEVEEGGNPLSPKTFTPTKSGWTFVGWRNTPTEYSVYSSLVMPDSPISLYAVFKQVITLSTVANGSRSSQNKDRYYNNGNVADPSFTVSNPSKSGASFLGWSVRSSSTAVSISSISNLPLSASTTRWAVFKYVNVEKTALPESTNNHAMPDNQDGWSPLGTSVIPFGWVYSSQLYSPVQIDTDKYSAVTIHGAKVYASFDWHLSNSAGALQVGSNISTNMWYGSVIGEDKPSVSTYFPVKLNISPGQGVQTLSVRFTVGGGYLNNARAKYLLNNNYGADYTYSLTGRTVVG